MLMNKDMVLIRLAQTSSSRLLGAFPKESRRPALYYDDRALIVLLRLKISDSYRVSTAPHKMHRCALRGLYIHIRIYLHINI